MFTLNDDLSIYATRGDIVFFSVSADDDGIPHQFQGGDVVRIKIYGKKDAASVVLQKDFPVTEATDSVAIFLTEEDTKIGEVISKPVDYWYEIELNPYDYPQTIIGYDEDGAKVFKLFPEGADIPEYVPEPEEVRVTDDELDMTSTHPIQNQAVARAVANLRADFEETKETITTQSNNTMKAVDEVEKEVAANAASLEAEIEVERARINGFTKLAAGSTTGDAELQDIRNGADGTTYSTAGAAVRGQINKLQNQQVYGSVFLNDDPYHTFVASSSVEVTLPGDVEILWNGKTYAAKDLTAKYEFTDTYALFNVLFNVVTSKLSVDYFRNPIPANTAIIGCVFSDVLHMNLIGQNHITANLIDGYNPVDVNVWCDGLPTYSWEITETGRKLVLNVPSLIVGTGYIKYGTNARTIECEATTGGLFNILYNRVTKDMILERWNNPMRIGYQRIGIVHTTHGVFMNGATEINRFNNMALAPLILGAGNRFIEFDSVNKVITFPNDTLIQANKTFYATRHYQLSVARENNTVSYAESASTALLVYYDTMTDKLGVTMYNQILSQDKIAIASFRTSNGAVCINAPYKWDGKPFNMNLDDLGIDALVAAANVKSVNHRGYCTKAPENTLAAYRLSAKNKFEYVECDISFTSDGVPVLLHDSTIDRTSTGTGEISKMTLAEARSYDYGSWFSAEYAGEQIPTAEEFIALCRKLGLHPYIELKSGTEAQVENLVSIVKKYGMLRNVTWISFNANPLRYVRDVDPVARLGYVVNSITQDAVNTALGLRNGSNEVFIDAGSDENISLCIAADIPVERWTVNSNSAVLALNPYVSGVTSDNVHAGRVLYDSEI